MTDHLSSRHNQGPGAFDAQLYRLFSQAPVMADAGAFAERLQRRLNRRWAIRRLMITLGGLTGGMITAWQVMSAHLIAQADIASQGPAAAARHAFAVGLLRAHMATSLVQALPFGGEALWLIAGLAAVAAALLATRLFETL